MTNIRRFRTGIISIGAFALGIAFERRFHLYADESAKKDNVGLLMSGDTVDGQIMYNKPNQGASGPVFTDAPHVAKIAKHGFPSLDSLRSYPNFVVSYDRRNRIANWVLEHLTKDHLASDTYSREGIEFFEDKSFHHFFRSTNSDYKGSGYDRGHLAAAGNYRANPSHAKETYVLSNIAPQVGRGFNRDKWNELEKYCRKRVRESDQAWICTGPLFLPKRDPSNGKLFVKYEVIGRNHVSVPTHFFKILLLEINGKYYMETFLMPNAVIPAESKIFDYRIDPEVVERAAGILLFNNIPRSQIKLIK